MEAHEKIIGLPDLEQHPETVDKLTELRPDLKRLL
jgi:hypothetical protein